MGDIEVVMVSCGTKSRGQRVKHMQSTLLKCGEWQPVKALLAMQLRLTQMTCTPQAKELLDVVSNAQHDFVHQ